MEMEEDSKNNNPTEDTNINESKDKLEPTPKHYECGITPEEIRELSPNDVLLCLNFSTLQHNEEEARDVEKNGEGGLTCDKVCPREGLYGQSYFIHLKAGQLSELHRSLDEFNMLAFSKLNRHLHFIVTKDGWEKAGFTLEQVAPLFRKVMDVANVSLPKEFVEYNLSHPLVPTYVVKKFHGQIRTLVDMLCELNNEHHFCSGEQVEKEIYMLLNSKKYYHTLHNIASRFSVNAICQLVMPFISNSGLDVERLFQRMKEFETDSSALLGSMENVYKDYVLEKTIKMVEVLNEFRRYTSPKALWNDLYATIYGDFRSGISWQEDYFNIGSHALFAVKDHTIKYWDKVAPNGILDNELYKDFMYRKLRRDIAELGLETVLTKDYEEYNYCHDDVRPKAGIVGPKYINKGLMGADMEPSQKRKLVMSCGWGKSRDSNIDYFEFLRILPLIEKDPKYVLVKKDDFYYCYLVPKDDVTLPIYHYDSGKILFDSEESQHQTIRNFWKKHPDLFPSKE